MILSSLICVFVVEFIGQYKWFGVFSTVRSCSFLMCVTDVYLLIYFIFMSRPSSMKVSIVLCYNMNKLTYLLTYGM